MRNRCKQREASWTQIHQGSDGQTAPGACHLSALQFHCEYKSNAIEFRKIGLGSGGMCADERHFLQAFCRGDGSAWTSVRIPHRINSRAPPLVGTWVLPQWQLQKAATVDLCLAPEDAQLDDACCMLSQF